MEWTDISITVAKRDADTAEAIATMVANGDIYIEGLQRSGTAGVGDRAC